jgi:glycosyltransferase involved in cell wall biosynthesis
LQPVDYLGVNNSKISVDVAIDCLRVIDNYLPNVRNVVVRGLDAALKLHQTRQFKYRTFVYLTDFYSYANAELSISDYQKEAVKQLSYQVHHFIVQTKEIDEKLRELASVDIRSILIQPPLPEVEFSYPRDLNLKEVSIVYAGKITPQWGVVELLDWSERLIEKGFNIKLTIIANKISAPGDDGKNFRSYIKSKFDKLKVNYIPGLSRDEIFAHLKNASFVWCYRPKELENSVLELSTKLLEAIAAGARAVNYPSRIHKNVLGKNYPFFVTSFESFENLLKNPNFVYSYEPKQLSSAVLKDCSISTATQKMSCVLNFKKNNTEKIVFAGHDRKFIDAYYSKLKSLGCQVKFDEWEWGAPKNANRSEIFIRWADSIFCEWGLANAVWYSKNNIYSKPLYIRIHLQEINEIARRFGPQINQENVTKFIVVSERVRVRAQSLFGWAPDKSVHIPNFVFDDEFKIANRKPLGEKDKLVIGMVGIVPQRKRFDRGIALLSALRSNGIDAELLIKGPRPDEYKFMHSSNRSSEMIYYENCFKDVDGNSLIRDFVKFIPWGNDMATWYSGVDLIISPSDFESFHYAVADGVLSGCYPLVWPWEEADIIYDKLWCVDDVPHALSRVLKLLNSPDRFFGEISSNRNLIMERYSSLKVFDALNELILREHGLD